ncbi:MAG: sodium:calcium antiporter [Hyphomicrobiales bacterium]|nr:sodium:calcium antiporter [Hyphomicrobiales bacterium]
MPHFPLPLPANIVVFLIAGAVVWMAGTRLVAYGDKLSDHFGLTRAFIGLVFLATVTELPEIVTTMTAAIAGNAQLVLGNMFGGITMQTAILAVVDLLFVRYALTNWPRKPTHALEAVLLVILLNIVLAVIFLGEFELFWGIGLGALSLAVLYPLVILLLGHYDEQSPWLPVDLPKSDKHHDKLTSVLPLHELSTRTLVIRAGFISLSILIAGYITANQAEIIAEQSGLGYSFVGVALLAASTSMPELSTTIAAARMGAYTMAISNIFGSNLIMVALILPADIAYRSGPLLANADKVAQFSIVTGILVTTIYITGILIRSTPRLFGAGIDSLLVLVVYLFGLIAAYHLS